MMALRIILLQLEKEFVDKYPNFFKVISKPNGGYGSTINAAIDAATGQYFKTLDGDDWYDTENLVRFVKDLKKYECRFNTHSFYNGL